MTFALDHVFICVDDVASAEHALFDFGIHVGRRLVHTGQGTANACAYFDNAYLELLHRHDDAALQSTLVRPLGLWERLHARATGAVPFGIALCPSPGAPTLETWPYEAAFLPAGAHIPIVTPRHRLDEPIVFLTSPSAPPAAIPPERRPPLEHRGARRRLTGIAVSGPRSIPLSPGLATLSKLGIIAVNDAATHHLDLTWDDARAGEAHDFRPALPLTLHW
ncbi:Hypothetical protein A7982_01539 [Minicystis rosea]|nr:Hypothetical protein A7982_01539 [Minicystis rosea]